MGAGNLRVSKCVCVMSLSRLIILCFIAVTVVLGLVQDDPDAVIPEVYETERDQRELLKNLLEAGFSQPPTNNKLKTTISRVAKTTNKSIIKVAKKMAAKLASKMVRQIDQKLHLQNASKFKHGSKSFTDSYTSAAAPTSAYASTYKTGAGPMKKPKMVVRLPTT